MTNLVCSSIISGQTLRACPEGRPVSTHRVVARGHAFPDRALAYRAVLAHHCFAYTLVAQQDSTQQVLHLKPRADMRHGWARTERDFIDVIDGGQAARIKLAEDHPLGQAFHAAEVEPS